MLRRTNTQIKLVKNIILTDVTLLQQNNTVCIVDKFHKVITNHRPEYMDLGKVIKAMDNWSFHNYANNYLEKRDIQTPKLYVTSPNEPEKYSHISFWTSLSSIYQNKTENLTIKETKQLLKTELNNTHKKLYVSCVSECPLTGPINIDYTLHELCRYYHQYTFDEITLCDSCGSLTYEDFKYLAWTMTVFGVPKSKIGFQLRMNKDSKQIVQYGYTNGFLRWDVVGDFEESKMGILTYKNIENWL